VLLLAAVLVRKKSYHTASDGVETFFSEIETFARHRCQNTRRWRSKTFRGIRL